MRKLILILSFLFISVGFDEVQDIQFVTATIYHAEEDQCNQDPSTTAFMYEIDMNDPYSDRIIAVSRDLLQAFPNESRVKIEGTRYDGIYTVRDKMNGRWTNKIDILINSDMAQGKWYKVKITRID
ncbi:hypothetical protein Phi19:2_gp062 [Cellulophaga phage phi19:2]|uniref:Uncharacterized protein n=3 Tax=Cellulophaga phage phiST TaxID=756282 RepID=M4SPS5_9CAUD|nr:hypothetical protein CGPG_00047 [Cellulophaga phage phiST]AGH56746.1 hypothetical protein CGPG_00047 [Cellulophaga phage phiST]AGO47201.1 hypothetical protein PhiST_gp062 [Cellulophaga phage phiST]AGO48697.1 hypothetical protein Phi19:2_gp062 [Cellulophaga phage phi19:2]AGO49067.1 hypothetical protein Phi13:1_gp056 [Cellulophaga phage phi13:1]